MRKGTLLSEAPPLEIMASCDANTLEDAFLMLSQKQIIVNTVMKVYLKLISKLE